MSDPRSPELLEFIPDVVGAHTTVFRSCLPHSEEFIDEIAPDDMVYGGDPALFSPEERARMEVEKELRGQMQQHLNALQEDVDRRLDDFTRQFEEKRQNYEAELREAAATLAMAIAERIIRREIELDPTIIERVVAEAVEGLSACTEIELHVHPEDGEHLRTQPELLSRLRVSEVVDDPRMQPGGCRLKSGSLAWEATLEQQLAEVRAKLDAALESA